MKKEFFAIVLLVILFGCKSEEDLIVTSIQLDKTELTLKVGEEYNFEVLKTPENAPTPNYIWSTEQLSGDGKIGEIEQNGKFTALKEGKIKVFVEGDRSTSLNGSSPIMSSCLVTVEPVKAEKLKLDQTEVTLEEGESKILACSFIPENTTDQQLLWKSSDYKIVNVTANGPSAKATVKAIGTGEAVITAYLKSNKEMSVECKVKVAPTPLEGLSLQETEKTVVQGEIFTLTPIYTPENATNKNITWSSSDDRIAQVDNNGKVTTGDFGLCIIQAVSEDGSFKASCKLTVTPIPVESIEFSKYIYKVEIGGEKQLSVLFTPANAGNKNIKWSTSNSIIAPIDENGIVRGNSIGGATIIAESEDGGYKASCQVQVADIDQFVDLYFPSASVVILNGYTTGTIYSGIINNSSKTITLTRFSIIDTGTWRTVAETTDESQLGILSPGQSTNLGGKISNVYEPVYVWEFTYNGVKYQVQKQYGKDSPYAAKIETKSYATKMFSLTKAKF